MNIRSLLRFSWFLALGPCGSVAAARAQTPDTPSVLPKVTVSADVPLKKVAEYHLREARFGPAAVAHGDSLYIIGGMGKEEALGSIERFDVRTGQTEPFAQLGTRRLWHAATVVGGKIYVLGGSSPFSEDGPSLSVYGRNLAHAKDQVRQNFDLNRRPLPPPDASPIDFLGELVGPTASVEVVDLAQRTVSAGPAMLQAKTQFACATVGGKLLVIGGQVAPNGRRAVTNSVEVLDLASGAWTRGEPSPKPRVSIAIPIIGGQVLYPGGYTGALALADVDVFNPRDRTWRSLPPLIRPTSAHSGVFLDHYLFLFGDYSRPGELIAYDLKTRTSSAYTLGYTPARHTAAVVHGDRIFVIGGKEYRESAPIDLIQVFELTRKPQPRGGS